MLLRFIFCFYILFSLDEFFLILFITPVYNFIINRLADESADIKIEWNVQIPMLVLIKRVKTKYLLLEQKKFQNKSKNICEVYQSESFRCIMSLSYRVTFLCNVLEQTHYTSESPVRYFFMKKL